MKCAFVLVLCFAVVPLVSASDLSDRPEAFDANYVYKPDNRPDPFVAFQRPIIEIPAGEMSVDQAVVVGITRDAHGFTALLQGADGKVRFLRTGAKLYDGEILKINSNRVIFKQILPAGEAVREREVTKELHAESASH